MTCICGGFLSLLISSLVASPYSFLIIFPSCFVMGACVWEVHLKVVQRVLSKRLKEEEEQ